MAEKVATITLRRSEDDPDKIKCAFDFHADVPVFRMFRIVGSAITGMLRVAQEIGRAKGMTDEEIEAAMFGE